jgi:hypothetical protein
MTQSSIIESISDRVSTVEFLENGIVVFKLEDHVTINIEDAVLHTEYLRERFTGEKFKVLVEPGKYTDISKEAREFSARPENNIYTHASAVVIKSIAQRLIMNFIVSFTRSQSVKIRMFDSREKALEWLEKQ